MRRSFVALALLAGCGIGARTGTSVSRTSAPVGGIDASLSTKWVELEMIGNFKFARAMFVLGLGNAHARLRQADTIYSVDSDLGGRLGVGIGATPVTFGPLRPIPYLLYNINSAPITNNGAKHTLEVGLDLELDHRLSGRTTSTFVLGLAWIRETGIGAFGTSASAMPFEFTSTGFMATVGWHFMLERFKE